MAAAPAYRGNPDIAVPEGDQRNSSAAVLSNCPTQRQSTRPSSTTCDRQAGQSAGGPYRKAITVLKCAGGWRVNLIASDTSKAFKP